MPFTPYHVVVRVSLQLGSTMGNVVTAMGFAIENMDMEKLTTTMDDFEKQFEQLDIQSRFNDVL